MAKTPSTSTRTRTGTSARSRSASVPMGSGIRRKVTGKTKQEVRDKLKALHADIEVGVRTPAGYTVQAAVDAWLVEGLSGRSPRTLVLYRDGVKPLTDKLGATPLRKLTAADVRSALASLSDQLSTPLPPDRPQLPGAGDMPRRGRRHRRPQRGRAGPAARRAAGKTIQGADR